MPGLEKIKWALAKTKWFSKIDPMKVIVVAGTNGKGSTCAILESLLMEADQKVGFYSSPHLVSTTERIRLNGEPISEEIFIQLFLELEEIINQFELSHFEALTLMAGHYFFSDDWNRNLDFVIFEVGLGGTFDATNAFPHHYSVITALSLDHTAILGKTIESIAQNKFGIIHPNNVVIHHDLPTELNALKDGITRQTNSTWYAADSAPYDVIRGADPQYFLKINSKQVQINLPGLRGSQNAMTALKIFEKLGFVADHYLGALNKVKWPGRMQKINWPGVQAPMYLSGDHNPQGIQSLLNILKDFNWDQLHLIVGIGIDKDANEMLSQLCELKNVKLYLTETPFKGLKINEYPNEYLEKAILASPNIISIIEKMKVAAGSNDLVLVTGSLYLIGEVLKASSENRREQKVALS